MNVTDGRRAKGWGWALASGRASWRGGGVGAASGVARRRGARRLARRTSVEPSGRAPARAGGPGCSCRRRRRNEHRGCADQDAQQQLGGEHAEAASSGRSGGSKLVLTGPVSRRSVTRACLGRRRVPFRVAHLRRGGAFGAGSGARCWRFGTRRAGGTAAVNGRGIGSSLRPRRVRSARSGSGRGRAPGRRSAGGARARARRSSPRRRPARRATP